MNIIELAIAAQLIDHRDTAESLPPDFVESLHEFAALVRAAALEEAALVCDQQNKLQLNQHIMRCLDECADAIRALKEKT